MLSVESLRREGPGMLGGVVLGLGPCPTAHQWAQGWCGVRVERV